MTKRLRISIDADIVDEPADAADVLRALSNTFDYDVEQWEVGMTHPVEQFGDRVGYWKIIEVES